MSVWIVVAAVAAVVGQLVERHYRPVRRLWCRWRGHRWRKGMTWQTATVYRSSRTCLRCLRHQYTGRLTSSTNQNQRTDPKETNRS